MNKFKILFIFVMLALCCTSCITNRDIKLLQKQVQADNNFFPNQKKAYKIQPYDNLYIKLISSDPETNRILNINDELRVASGNNAAAKYKDIYLVNDSGYVDIPQIGNIFVNKLSLEEASHRIENQSNKLYRDVGVVVRLADYSITILGEVNHPGRFDFYKDKITIFEAIGQAGDFTHYANRKKVAIIRQIENGSKVFYVDLTQTNALSSNNYYLMPNDLIYIEPLKQTFWDKNSFPFFSSLTLVLSTATSILVILSYSKRIK